MIYLVSNVTFVLLMHRYTIHVRGTHKIMKLWQQLFLIVSRFMWQQFGTPQKEYRENACLVNVLPIITRMCGKCQSLPLLTVRFSIRNKSHPRLWLNQQN